LTQEDLTPEEKFENDIFSEFSPSQLMRRHMRSLQWNDSTTFAQFDGIFTKNGQRPEFIY
jgi:hypothetical protein